jgi:hypothetical protein
MRQLDQELDPRSTLPSNKIDREQVVEVETAMVMFAPSYIVCASLGLAHHISDRRSPIGKTGATQHSLQEPKNQQTTVVVDHGRWNTDDDEQREGGRIHSVSADGWDLAERCKEKRAETVWRVCERGRRADVGEIWSYIR